MNRLDKLCPECKNIMSYDSYFGAFICIDCGHKEKLQNKPIVSIKKTGDIQKLVKKYANAN